MLEPKDRQIRAVGKTKSLHAAVGVKDGYIVQFMLDGDPQSAVEWDDGSIQRTVSVPELGIEAITPETNLQAVRKASGRPGRPVFSRTS